MSDLAVDTQPFIITLTYRVNAEDHGDAMELLVKYQSDPVFIHEQDLRKHRGSQVVDLLDCDVSADRPSPTAPPAACGSGRPPHPYRDGLSGACPEADAAEQAEQSFLAAAIEWRQHVTLHPANPFTQEMLDKLDALVILRGRK
jgi:hypothetical protein